MTTTTLTHTSHERLGPRLDKPRVLILLSDLAAHADAATAAEIEALQIDYEVAVLTRLSLDPHQDHAADFTRVLREIEAFGPEVLHAHGLHQLGFVAGLAEATGLHFTLRANARDAAALRQRRLAERMKQILRRRAVSPSAPGPEYFAGLKLLGNALCLGVLVLPFLRPWLVRAGVDPGKIVDCFPALRFAAFHDRSPNGDAVMHIGNGGGASSSPDILRLAAKVPGRSFNHYGPSSVDESLMAEAGLTLVTAADRDAMPGEYKKHRWLVYTGDEQTALADWPLAIAEAQAAGVGVCLPNWRPDLAHYVGDGAGILYGSIDELPAIVSGPMPEEMRERGFAQARKSDIAAHLGLLTDLWADHLAGRLPEVLLAEAAEAPLTQPVPDFAPVNLSMHPHAADGQAAR